MLVICLLAGAGIWLVAFLRAHGERAGASVSLTDPPSVDFQRDLSELETSHAEFSTELNESEQQQLLGGLDYLRKNDSG